MFEALHRFDRDLAGRVVRMVSAEKWLSIAILALLTKEQWKQLRSQEAYHRVREALERAARSIIQTTACCDGAEDVAQTALINLVETEWLRRFDDGKGSPTGYLKGAMFHQTRDAVRSHRRKKNAPLAQLPVDVSDSGTNDPSTLR